MGLKIGSGVELEKYYKYKYFLDNGDRLVGQDKQYFRTKFFYISPKVKISLDRSKRFNIHLENRFQKETVNIAKRLYLPNEDRTIGTELVLHNFVTIPMIHFDFKLLKTFYLQAGLGYSFSRNKTMLHSDGKIKINSDVLPYFYHDDLLLGIGMKFLIKSFTIGFNFEDAGDSKFYLKVPPLYIRGDESHRKFRLNFYVEYPIFSF